MSENAARLSLLKLVLEILNISEELSVHLQLLLGDLLRRLQVLLHVVGVALTHLVLQLRYYFALDRDQRRLLLHALQMVVEHFFFFFEHGGLLRILRVVLLNALRLHWLHSRLLLLLK